MFAGARVPQANGAVFTLSCESLSIRTEQDLNDLILMSFESTEGVAGVGIPQMDSSVISDSSQCLSIRTERY